MCNYVEFLSGQDAECVQDLIDRGIELVDLLPRATPDSCLCSINQRLTLSATGRIFKLEVFGWHEQEPVQ